MRSGGDMCVLCCTRMRGDSGLGYHLCPILGGPSVTVPRPLRVSRSPCSFYATRGAGKSRGGFCESLEITSLSIQLIPLELSMGAELRGPCPWVPKGHLGVSTRDPHIHPPICLHPHLSLGNHFLVLVVGRKDTILPQPLLLQYCI